MTGYSTGLPVSGKVGTTRRALRSLDDKSIGLPCAAMQRRDALSTELDMCLRSRSARFTGRRFLARAFMSGRAKPAGSRGDGDLRDWRQRPKRTWLALLILALVIVAALLTRRLVLGRDPLWTRIQETGVWRVGLDPSFPPFENLDPTTQQVAGLDVDLARAIAATWGVRVEFVGVGFDELMDAVSARRIDAAVSALPVIEHRTEDVAFSDPYIEAGTVLAVPVGSAIRDAEDLAGRRVAAEWGSTGDAEARRLNKHLDEPASLVLRESVNEALDAVLAGEADAALVDAISLALYAGSDRLHVVGGPLISEPYVIVLPKGAPELLLQVNAALAGLKSDGTLAQISARWLTPQ